MPSRKKLEATPRKKGVTHSIKKPKAASSKAKQKLALKAKSFITSTETPTLGKVDDIMKYITFSIYQHSHIVKRNQ